MFIVFVYLNDPCSDRDWETEKEQKLLGTIDEGQTRILTPEEVDELNNKAMRTGVLQSWDHFKDNGVMPYSLDSDIVTAHYYDWLRMKGIMEKPSDELSNQITEEAREFLAAFMENRKSNPTLSEKRLQELSIQQKKKDQTGKLKALCKKIAVRIFFEDLALGGGDLHEIINNHT